MMDHATRDQERHELFNILCKTCSRLRMLPKSTRMGGRLTGELVEMDSGGHAVIFRARYNNRSVAIKTIRVTTSNFDRCHSVSATTSTHLESFLKMRFVGILSGGHRVEAPSTPEHPAITWCGFGTTPAFDDI